MRELALPERCQIVMPVLRRRVKLAGIASVAGVIAPLLWLGFVNCCYDPPLPVSADGPPPQPRIVDHAVTYTPYVLWPAAVLFLPPTVSNPPPTRDALYGRLMALILANAGIYAGVTYTAILLWPHARHSHENRFC